jgi:hypothetical protein
MPWDYVIDADQKLVYSRGWCDVTDADVLDHQRKLAEDPQFRSDFSQIIDFLGASSLKALTSNGIRKAAERTCSVRTRAGQLSLWTMPVSEWRACFRSIATLLAGKTKSACSRA